MDKTILKRIFLLFLLLISYLALILTVETIKHNNSNMVIIIGGIIVAYISIFVVIKTPANTNVKNNSASNH